MPVFTLNSGEMVGVMTGTTAVLEDENVLGKYSGTFVDEVPLFVVI